MSALGLALALGCDSEPLSPGPEPTDTAPRVALEARVVDVFSRAPLAGMTVRVVSGPELYLTTDSGGRFRAEGMRAGAVVVEIAGAPGGKPYHPLDQLFALERDSTHTFAMIPFQQTQHPALGGISVLDLLKQMSFALRSGGVLAKWRRFPIPVYAETFFNADSVDYRAGIERAVNRWIDRIGFPVFEMVAAPPDTGVTFLYLTTQEMGINVGTTRLEFDAADHPIFATVRLVDRLRTEDGVFLIALHELGHTIPLQHFSNPDFIMYPAQPLPPDISEDEVSIVRLYAALPTRIFTGIYDETTPPFRRVAPGND